MKRLPYQLPVRLTRRENRRGLGLQRVDWLQGKLIGIFKENEMLKAESSYSFGETRCEQGGGPLATT